MNMLALDSKQRALKKLQSMNLTTTSALATQASRSAIRQFLQREVKRPVHMIAYLQAMKQTQLSPENILRYSILVHCYTQSNKAVPTHQLNEFLKYLLNSIPSLIQKYSETKNGETVDRKTIKTPEAKSTFPFSEQKQGLASTRLHQIIKCKQILLVRNTVSPYISYLMKHMSTHEQYLQIISKKVRIEKHQAWMLVNNLKIICSITNSFLTIGRYFMAYYGSLIILLIKCLAEDISRMTESISNFVHFETAKIYKNQSFQTPSHVSAYQLIQILEEVCKINDELFTVYIGKYYSIYLTDAPQPRWIFPQSTKFDQLYQLGNIDKAVGQQCSQREKKYKVIFQ